MNRYSVNIDLMRKDYMNMIANHFRGEFIVNLSQEKYSKFTHSNLKANLIPLEIYTRSIKYEMQFDIYNIEFIFYTSTSKSLVDNIDIFNKKLTSIVVNTFKKNNEEHKIKFYNTDNLKLLEIYFKKLKRINKINKLLK